MDCSRRSVSRCSIKIEYAASLHRLDRKAIEQDDLSLQCKHAHRFGMGAHRQDGLGAGLYCMLMKNGNRAGRLQRVEPSSRAAKIVGSMPRMRRRYRSPDHQRGLGFYTIRDSFSSISRRSHRPRKDRDLDRDAGNSLPSAASKRVDRQIGAGRAGEFEEALPITTTSSRFLAIAAATWGMAKSGLPRGCAMQPRSPWRMRRHRSGRKRAPWPTVSCPSSERW